MPKKAGQQTSFVGGIADSKKRTGARPYSFAYGRAIDFRSDPSQLTTNPKALLDSGTTIQDLVMWADRAGSREYFYGDEGNIYLQNSGWSLEHTAADSSGNGLAYFGEDRNLYYAQDKTIGRLTSANDGTGDFYDGFLESEGGDPTNTKSLDLERSSSEYASVADSANNSPTADITLEAYRNFESLPTTGQLYTLISKWNENSQRSFNFTVTTSSGYFGDGRDGALTISSPTTDAPIDANCTGTEGAYTLTTSNEHASFSSIAEGDKVLIIQMRGTNAGLHQVADVVSYSSNTLTIADPLSFSPAHSATSSVANKAQVIKLLQYTNVTINSTLTCKAWDGLKGGIISFVNNGNLTGSGKIDLVGKGFRGGARGAPGNSYHGAAGEGTVGASVAGQQTPNGGSGGGADTRDGVDSSEGQGGGGGGYIDEGEDGGTYIQQQNFGQGGNAIADNLLSYLFLGSAGGGGGGYDANEPAPTDGPGRDAPGSFFCISDNPDFSSLEVDLDGSDAGNSYGDQGGGGASSGGGAKIICNTGNLGTNKIHASGGARGTNTRYGGGASDGVVAVYYVTSITGTTTPTATSVNDTSLATSDGYALKLVISNDGTTTETYSQDITNEIATGQWNRWQVTFDASLSTAKFYKNGSLLGEKTGSMTAIYDSTAALAIGANFDSGGTAQEFFDGLCDDDRVWDDVRSQSELSYYNDRVLLGTEPNLIAYYKYEDDVTDSQTSGNNDLTHSGTATYSTDVPFSGVTTRGDEDVSITATGSTYNLATVIDEGATKRQSFTPTKEPLKSFMVDVNTIGTGDWTFTIHDSLNRTLASQTVVNANMATGKFEVVLDTPVRPILNATYHLHVTSTVADGILVSSSLNDAEGTTGNTGIYLKTFYQILVDDIYHPIVQHLNFLAVANERYLATYEAGGVYNPHRLTLPSGYRVRCLAFWREFLVLGTWRGTAITDRDQGRLFFWDGTSDTYNHFIDVPEGGINAMYGSRDLLHIMAGYEGSLLLYSGGGSAEKVDNIPEIQKGEYAEIAPGAMTMWRSILRYGATINTDSTNIHQGVYGYGTLNRNYPMATGFDHPLSLGDQVSSDVKIGCVFPSGQSLYVSWEKQNVYGVDKISVSNDPYSSATIELLMDDVDSLSKDKYPLLFRADFEALTSGQSVKIKFKEDRESSWRTLKTESTVGADHVRGIVTAKAAETQFACDITNTTSSVVITGFTLEIDDPDERRV